MPKPRDEGDLGDNAKPFGSLKVMKTQYEARFAAHVKAALEKATALGAKATWSTAKHLDALADVLTQPEVDTRDALSECYNVSAYQQVLAKKFEKTGHFQRAEKKSAGEQVDDLLSQLAASVGTPTQG